MEFEKGLTHFGESVVLKEDKKGEVQGMMALSDLSTCMAPEDFIFISVENSPV